MFLVRRLELDSENVLLVKNINIFICIFYAFFHTIKICQISNIYNLLLIRIKYFWFIQVIWEMMIIVQFRILLWISCSTMISTTFRFMHKFHFNFVLQKQVYKLQMHLSSIEFSGRLRCSQKCFPVHRMAQFARS